MSEPDSIRAIETPSSRRLLRSVAISAAVAGAILVAFVLPAEYGLDPTGIGRVLGLTEMGETKMRLAREEAAAAATPAQAPPTATAPATTAVAADTARGRSDVTEVRLAPGEGKEIKLAMRKGAVAGYSWITVGGVVNYDTHADSPTIKYHGYAKGTATPGDSGRLTAAFDGMHGWFWRNRGKEPVTVTLRTSGNYQELKRVQ